MRGQGRFVLDTDSLTFWQGVIGLLASALLAAREFYCVVELRTTPHRASWQEYLGLALGLWLFVSAKSDPGVVRAARFGLGLLLVVMGISVAISLMDLSGETAHALSFWSHVTSAILYSGVFLFLIVWLRDKVRDAKSRFDSEAEAVKKV